MTRFYEFHDSILKGIQQIDGDLCVSLRAIRTEWEDQDHEIGEKVYSQEIRLLLHKATMELDSENLPNWLLDGSYQAMATSVSNEKDIQVDLIPVSLVRGDHVQLRMEGMNEDTEEYISLLIKAESMKLEFVGEPELIGAMPPSLTK